MRKIEFSRAKNPVFLKNDHFHGAEVLRLVPVPEILKNWSQFSSREAGTGTGTGPAHLYPRWAALPEKNQFQFVVVFEA